MFVDIFNTDNKYDLIYTDPPWPQKKGGVRKCRPNQTRSLDYNTMSLEDIEEIHRNINKIQSSKCNVFMWTIDKYLLNTEAMMDRLGYTLHTRMIWDKENGVAPAFTVRFSHEYLLWFYRKGCILKPCPSMRGKYTTVFREKSVKHSQKPYCVYEMMNNMFPDAKKIELFARKEIENWDCWGNDQNILNSINEVVN